MRLWRSTMAMSSCVPCSRVLADLSCRVSARPPRRRVFSFSTLGEGSGLGLPRIVFLAQPSALRPRPRPAAAASACSSEPQACVLMRRPIWYPGRVPRHW